MRATLLPGILLGLVLTPATAGIISTSNYDTEAEALAAIVDGFFFVGHGDTEYVQITRRTPPDLIQIPFNLWNNGQPHAFTFSYDGAGLAAFAIDNVYRVTTRVDVAFFDGLLVTAHADDPNTSVLVKNLVITDKNVIFYPTPATAYAAGPGDEDYLLIRTDMNLAQKFILSGTATLTWPSAQPRPDLTHLWFEAAPVVIPEPAPAALLALAWLLVRPARPRR
jgi:hypothetical protein